MAGSFLFYDLETSGLNRAFDQILVFAGIRTDSLLNETERFTRRVRLRADVVPSPSAIRVNRLRVDGLQAEMSEYEALQEIHAELNRPETTSIGYNSIGFDDEFLRFAFHRNLLPVYTHQFAKGCRRMDLLPITIVTWLFNPELLQWPELDGKTSLRLEDIGAANGLFSGPSHEALADVQAALRLARRLFREEKMWAYLDGSFQKEVDARRMQELPVALKSDSGEHRLGVLVAGELGTRQRFQAPVVSLGNSIPYPKQTLWLRLDLAALRETQIDSVPDTTRVFRKRHGEPGILLPPVARVLEPLDPALREQMDENLAWLRSRTELFAAIIAHHRNFRYPVIENLDIDASLYQSGFLPRSDEALCRRFHAAALREKIDLAGRFTSPEARELARRILHRNFADALPPPMAQETEALLQGIVEAEGTVDYAGRHRRTPADALDEIQGLLKSEDLEPEQRAAVEALQTHLQRRFPHARPADSHGRP
jgi:exodeoxyribonuclease-1